MRYNRLGSAGIQVSELSFGSWITFSKQLDKNAARKLMHQAFDAGINFFDNAEVYANGESETIMGEILGDFKRSDLVVSTKIFWGGEGPNDTGLSWKHLVEGTKASLKRLNLDYVDLLFCHRPDPDTPMEETVRAMDHLVQQGYAFYWGTSEWSAPEIEQAHLIARELRSIPPVIEQPEYNLFQREKVEVEYANMYEKYGLGTTIWSPLASGVLTGKYNRGIPAGSRLEAESWLQKALTPERVAAVEALQPIAEELDATLAQLAIAWCLKNPNVSTVITGATNEKQLSENLKASEIKERMDASIMERIEAATSSAVPS